MKKIILIPSAGLLIYMLIGCSTYLNELSSQQGFSQYAVGVPRNLSIKVVGNKATLTWDASKNAESYNVHCYDPIGSYYGYTNETGTSHELLLLRYDNYAWSFYIVGIDKDHNLSEQSDTVTCTSFTDTLGYSIKDNAIALSWNLDTYGLYEYIKIYESLNKDGPYTCADHISEKTTINYTNDLNKKTFVKGTTYYFYIAVYLLTSEKEYQLCDPIAITYGPPAVPAHLTGKNEDYDTGKKVTLTWDKVTGAYEYEVYYYSSSSEPPYSYYSNVSSCYTVTATTFTDEVSYDRQYHAYWVKAVNSNGATVSDTYYCFYY